MNRAVIRIAMSRQATQAVPLDDQAKLHRAAGVFLARLLIVYGTDAPEQLRRMADELQGLTAERIDDGGSL